MIKERLENELNDINEENRKQLEEIKNKKIKDYMLEDYQFIFSYIEMLENHNESISWELSKLACKELEINKQNKTYCKLLEKIMYEEQMQLEGYESELHREIRETLNLSIEQAFGTEELI